MLMCECPIPTKDLHKTPTKNGNTLKLILVVPIAPGSPLSLKRLKAICEVTVRTASSYIVVCHVLYHGLILVVGRIMVEFRLVVLMVWFSFEQMQFY